MTEETDFPCPPMQPWTSRHDGGARELHALDHALPLRDLLDRLPFLVMVLDEERRTIFVNRALEELLQAEELPVHIGSRPGDALRCVNAFASGEGCGASDACQHCGALQAIRGALQGDTENRECHILARRQGGIRAFNFSVTATPLQAAGVTYTLVSLIDISHEKMRNNLQRVFFHDVLNSATAVSWFARMLQGGAETCRAETLDYLAASADRLLEEIRSQRMMLEAESGDLEVTWAPLDTRLAIEEIVKANACSEAASQRNLHLSPDTVAVEVWTDRALLGRVITNMLINALEASPRGGTVSLGCDRDGDHVLFWVHNAGAIPQDVQDRIYHRAFSTRGPHRGLGTYGMRLLGENHLGGEVSFATSPRDGTTFRLRLPTVPPHGRRVSGDDSTPA